MQTFLQVSKSELGFFFKWTWVAIISYLIASDDDMES